MLDGSIPCMSSQRKVPQHISRKIKQPKRSPAGVPTFTSKISAERTIATVTSSACFTGSATVSSPGLDCLHQQRVRRKPLRGRHLPHQFQQTQARQNTLWHCLPHRLALMSLIEVLQQQRRSPGPRLPCGLQHPGADRLPGASPVLQRLTSPTAEGPQPSRLKIRKSPDPFRRR